MARHKHCYESREQAEKDKCDDTVGTAKIEWTADE